MRLLSRLLVGLAALFAGASALADDRRGVDPFAALEPQHLLGGMLREQDVTLLFDYLRHGVAAAARGEEPPPPPEALHHRAEELEREMKLRGALAALAVLNALEARARDALREQPEPRRRLPPPTAPRFPAAR